MGSNRWATGVFAGVAVQDTGGRDCRIDVLDGEAFHHSLVGDSVHALDLTVHTQLIARATKGIRFGAHIAQIPETKVASIIAAIEAAMGAGNPFEVILADDSGIDNIETNCVVDFAALNGRIYQRGGMAAGYMKGVTFRFISV